jgi:hypothetical protein
VLEQVMIPRLAGEQRYVAATLGQRALEDRFLDGRHRPAEEMSVGQTVARNQPAADVTR